MEESTYSSRWDIMLSLLVEKEDFFKKEAKSFENEHKNIQIIHNCSDLRQTFTKWIESLEAVKTGNSSKLREKGNEVLKQNNNSFYAFKLYTEAIYMSEGSSEACLAHANRAYVLMQKGSFNEAYDDCECALLLGYPKSKRYKVILRQAECALFLNNAEKLKTCVRNLKEIEVDKVCSAKIAEKLSELGARLEILSSSKAVQVKSKQSNADKKQILCNSSTKGTYVVAGERIPIDDEIMTEDAFAFVPLYDSMDPRNTDYSCHNCAEVNIVPFPCNTCRGVSYCSIKCRELHNNIHRIECFGCKKRLFRDIGIAYLALRVLLVGFYDMVRHLEEKSNVSHYSSKILWEEILEFSNKNEGSPYSHVIRLVTCLKEMDSKDFIKYALTASMLVCYLKNCTQFFDASKMLNKIKMPDLDWETVVGALLLRHIGQMICNAHSITAMKLTDELKDLWKSKDLPYVGTLHKFQPSEVFSALYPRVSLYNHSCEPTFYNTFNRSSLTIKAARNLQVNDEIFNCYGINFKKIDKVSRKASLKAQYAFDCDCIHCEGEDIEFKRYHTYICTNINCKMQFTPNAADYYWWDQPHDNFKFQCPLCGSDFNWQWYQQFENIYSSIPEKHNERINWFSYFYETYHKSKQFLSGPNSLKQIMMMLVLDEFIDLPSGTNNSMNERMLEISIDLLNASEDKNGAHSTEFVYASTYFLDLLAKNKGKSTELKTDYNLEKILNSFDVLSENQQVTFRNYFKNYIKSE